MVFKILFVWNLYPYFCGEHIYITINKQTDAILSYIFKFKNLAIFIGRQKKKENNRTNIQIMFHKTSR